MTIQKPIERASATPPTGSQDFARASGGWHAQIVDDKDMLRAARDLTKDLGEAKGRIYWPDMLASAAVGYAAMFAAIALVVTGSGQSGTGLAALVGLGLVSSLGFYRALMFIHEISHIHRDALPGFRLGWNMLAGIPMLIPSFMYEGVHTLHHKRTQYGTVADPEYLPLALMKPWSLPGFVLVAILLPFALIVRSALLVPLGVIVPPLRRLVWQRFSSLAINPDFRRGQPEAKLARRVIWQEGAASIWALALIASTQVFGWAPLLTAIAILSLTALLNQLRTLVAHLWENEGEAMTVTAQFLDSVNVPPPGPLAELWAPVGLRYHALHHLMPSLPYHALPEAHRRLNAQLGEQSTYRQANHSGMSGLIARIARSTMKRG
jgi:fatty acid desaturase